MLTVPYIYLYLGSLDGLIVYTIVKWAKEGFIESLELIREMFSALHRQYNATEEVRLFGKFCSQVFFKK